MIDQLTVKEYLKKYNKPIAIFCNACNKFIEIPVDFLRKLRPDLKMFEAYQSFLVKVHYKQHEVIYLKQAKLEEAGETIKFLIRLATRLFTGIPCQECKIKKAVVKTEWGISYGFYEWDKYLCLSCLKKAQERQLKMGHVDVPYNYI